jgi:hypothetical protein
MLGLHWMVQIHLMEALDAKASNCCCCPYVVILDKKISPDDSRVWTLSVWMIGAVQDVGIRAERFSRRGAT